MNVGRTTKRYRAGGIHFGRQHHGGNAKDRKTGGRRGGWTDECVNNVVMYTMGNVRAMKDHVPTWILVTRYTMDSCNVRTGITLNTVCGMCANITRDYVAGVWEGGHVIGPCVRMEEKRAPPTNGGHFHFQPTTARRCHVTGVSNKICAAWLPNTQTTRNLRT